MTEPKTKAEWLREFADAMEADPDNWFNGYERKYDEWMTCRYWHEVFTAFAAGTEIRSKPRTVTRYDRNGKEVELPDLENRLVCVEVWVEGSNELPCAKEWRDHFSSLLEANDHD